MYRCPYCRARFESPDKQRCPHCRRVVLTPGFFKVRPRQPTGEGNAPLPPRRRVKPPALVTLFGASGFKVAIVLILLMVVGVALVSRAKNPPPAHSHARRIDRARLSLANLRVALEVFRDDMGAYPSTQDGLAALVHPPGGTNRWCGPYVYELKNDLWGIPFQYEAEGTNLVLFGCGPDGKAGTGDDIVLKQADIELDQKEGRVFAVVAFTDGSRKVIRQQVDMTRAIPAEMIPDPGESPVH